MRHSLSRIVNKQTDYVICTSHSEDYQKGCGILNWYENEECRHCGGNQFRPATQQDAEDFALDYSLAYDDDVSFDDIYAEVA